MINDQIQLIDLDKELKKSFMSYAMAVIVSRALPDVRDGLKPVHRRLLYSMTELGAYPDKPYYKSARIVGDAMGKYHPHGDSALYDTMVRMAQDFSMRAMLVDGQGNFGSVDGDDPAAMRYTEARMSRIALEMVADLDKETVDFYPNFDESLMQPSVLPCRFPNLLVNGSGGIAVGMATNIPPHNMGEVIDGYIHLIDNPDCTVEDLMQYIKGPDFPTGGVILGTSGIHSAYRTGRGRIIVRAKSDIELLPNNKSQIVITEIPYQVNKAKTVGKIADLVRDKKVEGIVDLRDESDRQGMRIVIELKAGVNAQVVLNTLYKHTQLQETFGAIMLAIVDNEPKILNLKDMLYYYLQHQKDVITRRTRFDLNRAQARAHILEGLLIALDNIDEVVETIKKSESTPKAREALMERFSMSEKQAQAVLDMRLARLTALERDGILDEYNQLKEKIDYYLRVLENEYMVLDIIKEEILEVKKKYADERRTEIALIDGEIDIEDLIDVEDIVITQTRMGYVKRMSLEAYRAQRRGGRGVSGITTRDEDVVQNIFVTSTHTDLLFFTNRGKVFRKKGYNIPEAGRTARGSAIVNLLQLDTDEKVTTILPVKLDEGGYLIMATKNGVIKKTAVSEFSHIRQSGLIAVNLRDGDELISVQASNGTNDILVGTRNGMGIRFNENDVRDMGRNATGVRSIDLNDDDIVVDMQVFDPVEEDALVLAIAENGYGKRTPLSEYRVQSRGGKGVIAMSVNEKTGKMVALKRVSDGDDILAISLDGTVIRFSSDEVSVTSRNTQGVRVMRMNEGSAVVAIEVAPKSEEE
ncbi:MAG: DNA gyrase subunit A [Clostridia bacterium]|nr:DNA gyrase subunit A [Clostridia bacterium]